MSNPPATPLPLPARRRLPLTLYILAGLMLLKAFLLFGLVAGVGLNVIRSVVALSPTLDLVVLVRETPGVAPVLAVFGAVLVISVLAMLGRRRIGWLLAMLVTGLFVAFDIYGFANNGANHLWMGLNIVTVFYLNQRDVREVVGATTSPIADDEAYG